MATKRSPSRPLSAGSAGAPARSSVRLEVRPTRAQKALVEEAASSLGQTVASFMLSTVLERANEVLLSRVRVLGDRDRDALLRALDDDEPPRSLVRAFANRKKRLRKQRA